MNVEFDGVEIGPIAGKARVKRSGGRELSPGLLCVVINLPTLVFLALVLAYPIVFAGYLSFHKVAVGNLRSGVYPFIGFENFRRIFADPLFLISLENTLIFTFVAVGTEIVLAVAIALLMSYSTIWTSRVLKMLVLLPFAVPPIANGLIWTFIYSFNFGFLNRVLLSLGLISTPINWIGNPNSALYLLALPYVWRSLPFAILLVHAALQDLNPALYEAAALDGATAWGRFRYITLPLLKPVIVVILVLRTSTAMTVFEEVLAITHGGPGDATWTAAWYSYRQSFAPPFDIGIGSASAYVLGVIIAICAIVYVKLIYRKIG